MGDVYYFPGEFRCMYCKEDFDPEGMLALPSHQFIDLTCSACNAVWRFWVKVQLYHKLVKGGSYNKKV